MINKVNLPGALPTFVKGAISECDAEKALIQEDFQQALQNASDESIRICISGTKQENAEGMVELLADTPHTVFDKKIELHLKSNGFSKNHILKIWKALGKNIIKFSCISNALGNDGLEELATYLKESNLTQLTELHLDTVGIDGSALQHLKGVLPKIEKLILRNCGISAQHVESLHEIINQNTSALDIRENNLGKEGLEALFEGISKGRVGAIEELNLSLNEIDDFDESLLLNINSIRRIDLSRNGISINKCKEIILLFIESKMEYLDLYGNLRAASGPITSQHLKSFLKDWPGVKLSSTERLKDEYEALLSKQQTTYKRENDTIISIVTNCDGAALRPPLIDPII